MIPFLFQLIAILTLAGQYIGLFSTACPVARIEARIVTSCQDNGTIPEWDDDFFVAHLTLHFNYVPDSGTLKIAGPLLPDTLSVSSTALFGLDSFELRDVVFKASTSTYRESIRLYAWFTSAPDCIHYEANAGTWRDLQGVTHRNIQAPKICSVCVGPPGSTGASLPSCFPPEIADPDDPCSDVLNYATDPEHPEHTAIHYVKVVLHIFQREHPDSLGRHVVHPTDPGNFTRADLPLIRSWFTEPEGINGFFSQIPDDPEDGSPHIPDARIRLLNEGIEGRDVFFHPDNKAWGMGYICGQKTTTGYYFTARRRYLLDPDSTLVGRQYWEALTSDDVQHALHVFIAGVSWAADDPDDAEPDSTDCIYYCTQGYSLSTQACFDPKNPPVYVISGTWTAWQVRNDPSHPCYRDYPGHDAAIGRQLIGEFMHLLSLDHISPFQAHWRHAVGADGCEDTPLQSTLNRMGCALAHVRTVLTRCQIGRMRYQLEHLRPAFLRYPHPGGRYFGFPSQTPTDPDVVIEGGEEIFWLSKRHLRSNIVVKSGGKLHVRCDLSLPAKASISVEPGGSLLLEGGRIVREGME
ncbi:MAG: hypothetical protein KatS3mg029_0998 [Saprospiraceae bacterium]|nr:MAG: hypothetical protein KatS3mg029_0998 [Saprospiraceae bacterium]